MRSHSVVSTTLSTFLFYKSVSLLTVSMSSSLPATRGARGASGRGGGDVLTEGPRSGHLSWTINEIIGRM